MPVSPDDLPEWKDADRISDRIIDLLNEESKRPNFSPLQMFAGQMLAMIAMLRTAPEEGILVELLIVRSAIELCLASMIPRKKPN
jgi:hypothetical protein